MAAPLEVPAELRSDSSQPFTLPPTGDASPGCSHSVSERRGRGRADWLRQRCRGFADPGSDFRAEKLPAEQPWELAQQPSWGRGFERQLRCTCWACRSQVLARVPVTQDVGQCPSPEPCERLLGAAPNGLVNEGRPSVPSVSLGRSGGPK